MTLPHLTSPIHTTGASVNDASAALILLHGRGAAAADILALSTVINVPQLAYLAPQAEENSWYPNRFIAPIEQNEPYLSGALSMIESIVRQVETQGIPIEKIFLGGFSQGACLATEYVIRNPKRYGGLLVFRCECLCPRPSCCLLVCPGQVPPRRLCYNTNVHFG